MKSPLPLEWVERIFQKLHGRFGNGFIEKFKTGQLDASGRDAGIENAKQVWAEELAGYSAERLKAGLSSSYDYPPSCDQFKANCKISVHPPLTNALAKPKPTLEEKAANSLRLKETLRGLNIKRMSVN